MESVLWLRDVYDLCFRQCRSAARSVDERGVCPRWLHCTPEEICLCSSSYWTGDVLAPAAHTLSSLGRRAVRSSDRILSSLSHPRSSGCSSLCCATSKTGMLRGNPNLVTAEVPGSQIAVRWEYPLTYRHLQVAPPGNIAKDPNWRLPRPL